MPRTHRVILFLSLAFLPGYIASALVGTSSTSAVVRSTGAEMVSLTLPLSVRTLNCAPTAKIELDPTYRALYVKAIPYDPNTKQDIRLLRMVITGPTGTRICTISSPFMENQTSNGDLRPQETEEGDLLFKIEAHRGEYTATCLVQDEEYSTVTAISWQVR